MTQLPLPIVMDCDPRVQLAAAHRLNKLVERERQSFRCEDYRRRRAAMLKHTRGLKPHPGLRG